MATVNATDGHGDRIEYARQILTEKGWSAEKIDRELAPLYAEHDAGVAPLAHVPDDAAPVSIRARTVTVAEFVSVDEEGAGALLGDADGALIPEGGEVMGYGDGGAGKTTLFIDLGFHLAAGMPWLGVPVQRPSRVLFVENEGPRSLFRAKLRRKLAAWQGASLGDRVCVVEEPWAGLRFDDPAGCATLAAIIREREIDVVIVGPVAAAGMNTAGTLQDVRAFVALIATAREQSGRRVTFLLVHHENKSGSVSGAWEGAVDTLFQVSGQGHGRTRLHIQKARWSSAHHGTTLQLTWSGGDGFTIDEQTGLDDATVETRILDAVKADPGTGWTRVEGATLGVGNDRRRAIRDGLLAAGRLVNVRKLDGLDTLVVDVPERVQARLYLPDDPTIRHLRHAPGAGAAHGADAGSEDPLMRLRRAPRPIGGHGVGAAADDPADAADPATSEGAA